MSKDGMPFYLREQQHRSLALLFATSWLRNDWLFQGTRAMCVGQRQRQFRQRRTTEHLMLESPYSLHLPIFPCFYDKPSEDRLEAVVSRLMDRADSALLSGKATQVQYDA
jgi:hypothetical protein